MLLYKYFPPIINSLKSLINSGIWCDSYTNMNDPFESLEIVSRSYSNEQIKEFKEKALSNKIPHWKMMAKLEDKVIVEFLLLLESGSLKIIIILVH